MSLNFNFRKGTLFIVPTDFNKNFFEHVAHRGMTMMDFYWNESSSVSNNSLFLYDESKI
jgi:hypothetical protein